VVGRVATTAKKLGINLKNIFHHLILNSMFKNSKDKMEYTEEIMKIIDIYKLSV
jgi:hypothetical protein